MTTSLISGNIGYTATGIWSGTVSSVALAGGGTRVEFTMSAAHLLPTGAQVTVSGSTGVTGLNATWYIIATTTTKFELVGSESLTGTPGGSPVVVLPSLDISGLSSANPTLFIRCDSLTSGKKVTVAVEDTVDAFSNTIKRYVASFSGEVQAGNDVTVSFPMADIPQHRVGTGSAKMRVTVIDITAATTAKVSAWVQS